MLGSGSSDESSLLIQIVAALIVGLAAHVAIEWVSVLQRREFWRERWQGLLLAAFVLGTGLCGAIVLSITAEALSFRVGYNFVLSAALWAGAVLGCLPICAWLSRSPGRFGQIGAGVLLGLLTLGLQMGWFTAIGFRPGITWRPEYVTAAAMLLVVGCCVCLILSHPSFRRDSQHRIMWRIGVIVLMGLTVVGGQEVLGMRIGLQTQVGSLYQRQLPASVISMLAGLLLPLVLLMLALDLQMRRKELRRSTTRSGHSAAFSPKQARRKRRHRVRTL